MMLTKNFSIDEFHSHDGAEMPDHIFQNVALVAVQLQKLRDYINAGSSVDVPISVNSGYRSPEHNAEIGGVPNSTHTIGIAADITVSGFTPSEVADVINELRYMGQLMIGGLGVYHEKNFIHFDIRGYDAFWQENKEVDESVPNSKKYSKPIAVVLSAVGVIGACYVVNDLANS